MSAHENNVKSDIIRSAIVRDHEIDRRKLDSSSRELDLQESVTD